MNNCPWCGSEFYHRRDGLDHYQCASQGTKEHGAQSRTCRISELEAERAGVEGLLSACLLLAKSQSAFDDACDTQDRGGEAAPDLVKLKYTKAWSRLEKCCREFAKSKEVRDEPAE